MADTPLADDSEDIYDDDYVDSEFPDDTGDSNKPEWDYDSDSEDSQDIAIPEPEDSEEDEAK